MPKTGRKRISIDDPRVERLLNALKVGHFVEEACKYAPLSKQTYYRWLREGELLDARAEAGETLTPDEQGIRDLCDAIKAAEVSGQNLALDKIREAINLGTWQAAAWFMERRNKKWSNRTEVTGPDGGPVRTVTVEDVDEKIRNLIAASEADRGGVDNPSHA
jgi:hypothetical protein